MTPDCVAWQAVMRSTKRGCGYADTTHGANTTAKYLAEYSGYCGSTGKDVLCLPASKLRSARNSSRCDRYGDIDVCQASSCSICFMGIVHFCRSAVLHQKNVNNGCSTKMAAADNHQLHPGDASQKHDSVKFN